MSFHKAQELLRLYDSLGSTTVGLPPSVLVNSGAIASVQRSYLPDALAKFHQHCPQCRSRVVPGLSMELVNLVDTGEIDMAVIIRPPFSLQSDLRWTTLALEPYRLIVPRAVPGDDWTHLLCSQPFIRYDRTTAVGRKVMSAAAVHGHRTQLELGGKNALDILDDADLELLARHECSVAHCPTSNMKLASGIAPVPRLVGAGLRVGLGTDGAASNNRLDLIQEMRHAALLAKVGSMDASALPAHAVLRMATLDGARALGLGEHIGSIESGKFADLCAVDLGAVDCQPCFEPVSHLVHVAGREHVSHVWVNGETRVDKGIRLLHINDSELLRLASMWQTKVGN